MLKIRSADWLLVLPWRSLLRALALLVMSVSSASVSLRWTLRMIRRASPGWSVPRVQCSPAASLLVTGGAALMSVSPSGSASVTLTSLRGTRFGLRTLSR